MIAESYPEKGDRKTAWFSFEEATAMASQPGLRAILRKLQFP